MTLRLIPFFIGLGMGLTACGNPSGPVVTSPMENPYFKATDKMVTVNGVSLRYREEGNIDAPTLVMIHGFTSSLETWDALAADLSDDFRLIRLDLPGHGLSGTDPLSDYSNTRTVEVFNAFVKALDLETPTLLGNSLGGLVAWRAVVANPDIASKLVLISPGGFSINGVTETPVEVPMMVKYYLTKAPEAGVKQASAALFGDASKVSETRISQMRDLMLQPGNGDAFVARAGQFTLPNPEGDLAKVEQPTLIIWGDRDVMVPPEQGQEFANIMPNAKLISYEGVGHVPQEEATSRLAADIRDFILTTETP
ncbi:alpha/beta hydrolase [Litorimonas cladophorae]|uniref:Alpha/beta hydrolase n=1 Tax=Litorimonas cladophorae TaxID=1220491 RepID=A0A918KRG6_9PROT|nr:alpha/beta hydrolase [Litorimonas cladophorae]GGX73147.1 alpha/beta hydrolase [Litorimonas cladophorae]